MCVRETPSNKMLFPQVVVVVPRGRCDDITAAGPPVLWRPVSHYSPPRPTAPPELLWSAASATCIRAMILENIGSVIILLFTLKTASGDSILLFRIIYIIVKKVCLGPSTEKNTKHIPSSAPTHTTTIPRRSNSPGSSCQS